MASGLKVLFCMNAEYIGVAKAHPLFTLLLLHKLFDIVDYHSRDHREYPFYPCMTFNNFALERDAFKRRLFKFFGDNGTPTYFVGISVVLWLYGIFIERTACNISLYADRQNVGD